MMRITIEIDENSLSLIQQATGESKKSPAVQRALAAFLEERRMQEFLKRVREGQTDFSMSNDELEGVLEHGAHRHIGLD